MYCNKCGSPVSDDAAFCGQCGARLEAPASAGRPASSPSIDNLRRTLRAFFSKHPESCLSIAGASQSREWVILFAANILMYALCCLCTIWFCYRYESYSVYLGNFFLYGFLIALFANGIVFGAYCLLQKAFLKGDQDMAGMLNTVAASTLPLTLCFALSMILVLVGVLVWGLTLFLLVPLLLIAGMAQAVLLYKALQESESEYRVSFICFLGVCLAVLILVLLFCYLFSKAAFASLL